MATIWGGSVFYGGLLGGILAGADTCARKGRPFDLKSLPDSPSHPLFHVFGRVGCFLGRMLLRPSLCLGLCLPVQPCGRGQWPPAPRSWWKRPGIWFCFCSWPGSSGGAGTGCCLCIWPLYAPARFLLEFLRGDAYRGIFLGLSTSQWISLFLFPAALYALLRPRN